MNAIVALKVKNVRHGGMHVTKPNQKENSARTVVNAEVVGILLTTRVFAHTDGWESIAKYRM